MTKKQILKELKERSKMWEEAREEHNRKGDWENANICYSFKVECDMIRALIESELL